MPRSYIGANYIAIVLCAGYAASTAITARTMPTVSSFRLAPPPHLHISLQSAAVCWRCVLKHDYDARAPMPIVTNAVVSAGAA